MSARQSSYDARRGLDCQSSPFQSPRHRYRSESSEVIDRKQPRKPVTRKREHCLGAYYEGASVHVFSRSAGRWVAGKCVEYIGSKYVRVEYAVGMRWLGKHLHVDSKHLKVSDTYSARLTSEMSAWSEHDPEGLVAKPLAQGCRDSLPSLSKRASYYRSEEQILKMVKDGDVALLRGSWLLYCYKQFRVLPCRQFLEETEPPAFWTFDDLHLAEVFYVSISHCWYTKEHPDPTGLQVQQIGLVLDAFLSNPLINSSIINLPDPAIFWCWCSFFQGPRSEYEQQAFERSMQIMDLWYTNEKVNIWMLTAVPVDVPNNTPYNERGWTTWERSVAQLLAGAKGARSERYTRGSISDSRMILDISALDGKSIDFTSKTSGFLAWNQIEKFCCVSGLPLSPDAFIALMREKTFTKGATDLELVVNNYVRNFSEVVSVADSLSFSSDVVQFGINELRRLNEILPLCTSLRVFGLQGSRLARQIVLAELSTEYCVIDDLLDNLAKCRRLVELKLNCGLGDARIPKLLRVVACMPRLKLLDLCKQSGNQFSNPQEFERLLSEVISERCVMDLGVNLNR